MDRRAWPLMVAVFAILALAAGAAEAATLNAAIASASPGDTILVGPGIYGDLDGDGNFTPATGEEAAEVGFSCDCMIKVNKALTIISRDGADATVLDAGASTVAGVNILAGGVIFGQPKKGFTIWRAGDAGLTVDAKADQVKIGGNISKFNGLNCASGCSIPPGPGPGFRINGGSGHQLTGNHAVRNTGSGFLLSGDGLRLSGNLASENNGAGYFISGSNHVVSHNSANNSGGDGFALFGANFSVTGNAAGANGDGFSIDGDGHEVKGNVASGNLSFGFNVTGGAAGTTALTRNAARGNLEGGVLLGAAASVTGNDLYGNNDGVNTFGFTNCGLVNDTGAAVSATGNFWGAAAGPGANPADVACTTGGATTVAPFAAAEIPVTTFPFF